MWNKELELRALKKVSELARTRQDEQARQLLIEINRMNHGEIDKLSFDI